MARRRFFYGSELADVETGVFSDDKDILMKSGYNEIEFKFVMLCYKDKFRYFRGKKSVAWQTFRYRSNFVISRSVITRLYCTASLV
jgi:hypothetical protein